jgi:hypothetical protein
MNLLRMDATKLASGYQHKADEAAQICRGSKHHGEARPDV